MTPERWQQADQLLQAVLELQPEAHRDYLAAACAGDLELRQEVETLLQFHQRLDGFLDKPPVGAMAQVFASGQVERTGQSLGRYEIVRAIGRGGMGEVYLARDTQLGRKVALKLLPERFTQDPYRLSRFRQEARAASALNHPNILTIHEIGAMDGIHFIAAEFVEGRTLRALIEGNELKLGAVLDLALQTANALAAAHQAGITHRDIKPENLMLRPDGFVKVLDFGLAKLNERLPNNSRAISPPTVETKSGMVMGTVSYMSPEQARGLEVDARTDIFSLGVVLYELITSNPPFSGMTSSDVLAALLTAEPLPLTNFVPSIPAELQTIVSRALAKEREARYQSATELYEALKHLKEELEMKARLRRSHEPRKDGGATLELSLGRAAQYHVTQSDTRIIAGRSTSRLRTLLARFNGTSSRGVRLAGGIAASLLLVLMLVWAVSKYWYAARNITPINTLAVLPFKPLVAGTRDEVLEMGIADNLITQLSRLKNISVSPMNAVSSYSALDQDPIAIGRKLRVQAVLEGHIQKADNKIRITARLIRLVDGQPLWTRQFDEPWTNIFAVQDAIAQRVADDLLVTLNRTEQSELTKNYTNDPEAYRLYLSGSYQWNKRTAEGIRQSVGFFQQAIAKDPGYALAYVGLANAYITLGTYHVAAPKDVLPLAREAAAQALKIDEHLAEAHTALGKIINDYYWDWPQAEREFQRALELKPNYPILHDWYAAFLANMGRFDEGIREARLELELDPLSPIAHTRVGIALYFARRYDQAIPVFQKLLAQEPKFIPARIYLGLCYLYQGKQEEALAEFQKGRALAPDKPDFISLLGNACGLAGRRDEARRYQEQLNEMAKHTYVSPFAQAAIPAGLGEMDVAFRWIEKCFEERSPVLGGLKTDPMFDILRADPRFVALLPRAGFAQ